ncbi:MAG: stilbene synthase [Candidatus Kapabacteria bacterium]|nr:stilbene synthase [Candidatus Kapabacteria bacterium]
MSDIRILDVATAVPQHVVDQSMVRGIVERVFGERVHDLDRLLRVFEHDHIHTRHFVRPTEWYERDHGFGEANSVFAESALELSERAARLAAADRLTDVQAIVVVSSTGIMTPSLDAALIQRLGLSPSTRRLPIFGLGCAGGVAGLARAAELSRGLGGSPVLMIAVEICSVTFRQSDTRKSNIVASSIFGDGAAAVLVGSVGTGPAIVDSHSTLFPGTDDIMGWDVTDNGLSVRFSRDIPAFVREHVPAVLEKACTSWGVPQEELREVIAHPGGSKVLEAYADATGLAAATFDGARDVLRSFGNMSSASVLFVLHQWMNSNRPRPRYSVMAALGPGFSSELLLLRNMDA